MTFGNEYIKGDRFLILFGDVAFVVTKFPKELFLVGKCRTEMMRNSEHALSLTL